MNTSTRLQIAVNPPSALMKITGRACHTSSVDFKTAIYGLRERGFREFILDLTDCVVMDSTFVGILAGFSLKLRNSSALASPPRIRLLNPADRICDLLENLGIADLFEIQRTATSTAPLVDVKTGTADKKQLTAASLEAHLTLMALNPENVVKFKDVAHFLAEDLDKLEQCAEEETKS